MLSPEKQLVILRKYLLTKGLLFPSDKISPFSKRYGTDNDRIASINLNPPVLARAYEQMTGDKYWNIPPDEGAVELYYDRRHNIFTVFITIEGDDMNAIEASKFRVEDSGKLRELSDDQSYINHRVIELYTTYKLLLTTIGGDEMADVLGI